MKSSKNYRTKNLFSHEIVYDQLHLRFLFQDYLFFFFFLIVSLQEYIKRSDIRTNCIYYGFLL